MMTDEMGCEDDRREKGEGLHEIRVGLIHSTGQAA